MKPINMQIQVFKKHKQIQIYVELNSVEIYTTLFDYCLLIPPNTINLNATNKC